MFLLGLQLLEEVCSPFVQLMFTVFFYLDCKYLNVEYALLFVNLLYHIIPLYITQSSWKLSWVGNLVISRQRSSTAKGESLSMALITDFG